MANHQLAFGDLIESISRAVAQAQDAVEQHQITNLLSYFDEDSSLPHAVMFKVPSRSPKAGPADFDFYQVPLLSLVPVNMLKIKDVRIKFAVDMGSSDPAETNSPAASPAPETKPASPGAALASNTGVAQALQRSDKPMRSLGVSTTTGAGGGRFKVTLRVKGSKPAEGAARLLDYLAQSQGAYPSTPDSPATSRADTPADPRPKPKST